MVNDMKHTVTSNTYTPAGEENEAVWDGDERSTKAYRGHKCVCVCVRYVCVCVLCVCVRVLCVCVVCVCVEMLKQT